MKKVIYAVILFMALVMRSPAPSTVITPGGGSGGTATNIVVANTVFVTKTGVDATGARQRLDKPFLTISAAKTAASAGDTIIVSAGTYIENNLLKSGVKYFFNPGAIVRYQQDLSTGTAYGIFDDRGSGATTNTIGGYGVFIYHAGTNGDLSGFDLVGNPLCRGAVVVTNANTVIYGECEEIQATSYDRSASSIAALYVENCRYVNWKAKRIYDPHGTNTLTLTGDLDGTPFPFDVIPNTAGVLWGVGDCHVECEDVNEDGHTYAVWCVEAVPGTSTSFYYTGNVITGKTYISGTTANWRTWFDVKWMNGSVREGYYVLGGGKHYLTAQKVSTDVITGNGAVVNSAAGAVGGTNGVWMNIEKVSSPGHWIVNASGGITFANIQNFEDTGSVTNGIQIDSGELHLDGGYAKVKNGNALLFNGGSAYVKNLTLHTSLANNIGNTPVFVTANGLYLQGCVLVAPALADSIKGSGSLNVGIYGTVMANRAKNANITVIGGGTLTVDSGVQ